MTSDLIVIIGSGPAGCAAGTLLARWGHRVVMIDRPAAARRPLAESIPPSAQRVLAAAGFGDAVERAGFQPWRGNTVWWGSIVPRVESFPVGVAGYQVDRARFDEVLRAVAATAGVRIQSGTVRDVTLASRDSAASVGVDTGKGSVRVDASFLIDASGRAGVVARLGPRRQESSLRTVALAGTWAADAWPAIDPAHTLVASYAGGWAWSVATDARTRQFTVMVDPARSGLARDVAARDVYLTELAKVAPFGTLLATASLIDGPWGADASQYDAIRYAGPGFLLAGDAASFIDPLSSVGVKKALASGWLAAVVVNTIARAPAMTEAALQFFDRRERDVFVAARRQAAAFAAQAASDAPPPFWLPRAGAGDEPHVWSELDASRLARDPDVQTAFRDLRTRDTLRLRRGTAVEVAPRPMVRGRDIVMDDHLLLPDAPDGVRYLRGIDLLALAREAVAHEDVGAICDAVARTHPAVELPDLLGALSFLIARGVLRHTTG